MEHAKYGDTTINPDNIAPEGGTKIEMIRRPNPTYHTIEREGDHVVVRIDAREADRVLILFESPLFSDFPSGWVVQEGQIGREIPKVCPCPGAALKPTLPSSYVNDADIRASDRPLAVVQKLDAAARKAGAA